MSSPDTNISKNRQNKRPSTTFTLPQAIVDQLDEIPKGEKSGFIEEAISLHLAGRSEYDRALSQLIATAEKFTQSAEIYGANVEEIRANLSLLSDHVAFQSATIEQLFGIKRIIDQPLEITESDFNAAYQTAVSIYAGNPALLTPNLKAYSELEYAAFSKKMDLLREETQALIASMPFMADKRFFCVSELLGYGVFDREFPRPEGEYWLHSEKGGFMVLNVSVSNPQAEMHLLFPKERPFFQISPFDHREQTMVVGRDEVAKAMPMIVGDYLAYRRFKESER